MTENEKRKLEQEYQYLLLLLDFYVKNREAVSHMNDQQYKAHIDDILDEMNRIKKILSPKEDKNS